MGTCWFDPSLRENPENLIATMTTTTPSSRGIDRSTRHLLSSNYFRSLECQWRLDCGRGGVLYLFFLLILNPAAALSPSLPDRAALQDWVIAKGIANLEQHDVINVSHDITVDAALDWCAGNSNCSGFSFPPKSFRSLLTVDLVLFLSRKAGASPSKDISLPPSQNAWLTYFLRTPDATREEDRVPTSRTFRSTMPYRSLYGPHCCHDVQVGANRKNGLVRFPSLKELEQAETIDRIPCNISSAEFVREYESKRIPVVIEGCAADWSGKSKLDEFDTLVNRFDNTTMWNSCENSNISWSEVQEHMNEEDVCIFDQIGYTSILRQDYATPAPISGLDMYEHLDGFPRGLGPMAWFSFGSNHAFSSPHVDKHLPAPDQWNTLIRGHKWWILYEQSKDFDEYDLDCDSECSTDDDIDSWYANVGFHALKFKYQGDKHPIHVLQRPGDTLYIPDGWVHALFNLDDCIAVTQGYGSASNLANIWKQVLVKGDERDWTRLYYTVFNAKQRKMARSAVRDKRLCIAHQKESLGDYETLCRETSFFDKLQTSNTSPVFKPVLPREPLLTRTSTGYPLYYLLPSQNETIVGVLVYLHGCGHSGHDMFLLPEERLVVAGALQRGLAVLSLESTDREEGCWSDEDIGLLRNPEDGVDVVSSWMASVGLPPNLPRLGMGVSSGASILFAVHQILKVQSAALYIVYGDDVDPADAERSDLPPIIFIHMPRDDVTAQDVDSYLSAMRINTIPTQEVRVHPQPFDVMRCTLRLPELGEKDCERWVEHLMASHPELLDPHTFEVKVWHGDSRWEKAWSEVFAKRMEKNMTQSTEAGMDSEGTCIIPPYTFRGKSWLWASVIEEIGVCYADHKMVAEHLDVVLDFLMGHAGL